MKSETKQLSERLEQAARQRARDSFEAAMQEPWGQFTDALSEYVAKVAPRARLSIRFRVEAAFDIIRREAMPEIEGNAVDALASAIESLAADTREPAAAQS